MLKYFSTMEFHLMIYSFILIAICVQNVHSSVKELTEEEKGVLKKFKTIMSPEVPRDYMKEDYFLTRWLRAQKFDMGRAERMLKEHIKWRAENRMDEILHEDWSTVQNEYPMVTDVSDKEGRPIFTFHFGKWDFQKEASKGNSKKLARWVFRGMETAEEKVRKLRSEGKNVTQWNLIVNLDKMNLNQHVCPQCLEIYSETSLNFDKQYQGAFHRAMLVNTPEAFNIIKNIAWPLMTKETQDSIEVLSPSSDWKNKVFDLVDREQFPDEVIPKKDSTPGINPMQFPTFRF